MKKKTGKKKIAIHRETVRTLNPRQAGQAAGGRKDVGFSTSYTHCGALSAEPPCPPCPTE